MKSLKIVVAAFISLAGASTCLYAQDSLIGKYSGNYETFSQKAGRPTRIGISLTVVSVENTKVTGIVDRHAGSCKGEYPVEGTYKGNQLVLKSGKGGAAEDCTTFLRLTSEGNKLTGTVGKSPIELSK